MPIVLLSQSNVFISKDSKLQKFCGLSRKDRTSFCFQLHQRPPRAIPLNYGTTLRKSKGLQDGSGPCPVNRFFAQVSSCCLPTISSSLWWHSPGAWTTNPLKLTECCHRVHGRSTRGLIRDTEGHVH